MFGFGSLNGEFGSLAWDISRNGAAGAPRGSLFPDLLMEFQIGFVWVFRREERNYKHLFLMGIFPSRILGLLEEKS